MQGSNLNVIGYTPRRWRTMLTAMKKSRIEKKKNIKITTQRKHARTRAQHCKTVAFPSFSANYLLSLSTVLITSIISTSPVFFLLLRLNNFCALICKCTHWHAWVKRLQLLEMCQYIVEHLHLGEGLI